MCSCRQWHLSYRSLPTAMDPRPKIEPAFNTAAFSSDPMIPVPRNRYEEVITNVPSDRLLVETDSPHLLLQKYRGKDNEPAYIMFTVG